jgi:hypothetical protein
VLRVFLAAFGIRSGTAYLPYAYGQVIGGLIGLGVLALWKTRHDICAAAKGIVIRESSDDSTEPIKYRSAFLGLILGLILVLLFFDKTGMPIWAAIVFLAIHVIISVAITRMRAELGTPFHEFVHAGADKVLISVFGSRSLGTSTLALFIPLAGITSRQRANSMPHQLEGFKMAEGAGINNQRLFGVMAATSVWGAILSFWLILHSTYKYGTNLLGFGNWAVPPVKNLIINPVSPNYPDLLAMGFAFGFTLLLAVLRSFLWWPISTVVSGLGAAKDVVRVYGLLGCQENYLDIWGSKTLSPSYTHFLRTATG